MYCSSCGGTVESGLNYCKHCGEKLATAKDDGSVEPSGVKPELLVSSIVALFVLGLGAVAILIGVMKQVVGFDLNIILAVIVLSFALLFSVEGILIWLLMKGKRKAGELDAPPKKQQTMELKEMQPLALQDPVPSVTEHTTRKIGHIFSERK